MLTARGLMLALALAAAHGVLGAASIPGADSPRESFAGIEGSSGNVEGLLRAADEASAEANYHQAASLLEQLVRIAPNVSEYRIKLGVAYERQAESAAFPARLVRRARNSLRRAIQLQPDNAEAIAGFVELAYLPAGVCYGNLDEAAMLLGRLHQLDPARAEIGRSHLEDAKADARSSSYRVRCGAVSMRQWVARQCAGHTKEMAYQTGTK